MITTGDLKSRVEFYTVSSTADGEGGTSTPVYTLSDTRWAKVQQLSEAEIMRSGLNVGERAYKITLQRSIGESLSKSLQIRWNGLVLNITSVVSSDFWFTILASNKE